MIEIKYICSNGKEYNLIGNRMRATGGYFHNYEWKPSSTEMELGEDVYGFTKEGVTYSITLSFRGRLEERKRLLDELTDAFEYDVVNETPGRIYYGDYYIECYIISSSDEVSGTWNNWTERAVEIYCPYPFWSDEDAKSFYPNSANKDEPYEFLDYTHGYEYDYSRPATGTQSWEIDHYRSSNFKMTIYGPCSDPRIVIDGHVYQVYDTLESGEYIQISSKEKTVTKHLRNGTTQNAFAKRRKDASVFELIPAGNIIVSWNGEFGFDITVYKERSVPRWS